MTDKPADVKPEATNNADLETGSELEVAKPVKVFSISAARAVSAREDKAIKHMILDEFREPMMTTDEAGNPVPAFAMVKGKLSKTWREAELAVNDKTLKKRITELTAEGLELQELTKVATCVESWNLRDNNKPIPTTINNLITVFMAAPWVRRDMEQTMGDSARFL